MKYQFLKLIQKINRLAQYQTLNQQSSPKTYDKVQYNNLINLMLMRSV